MQTTKKEQHAKWCATKTAAGACDCNGHAPRREGVYMIYNQRDGLAYIGSTGNFRNRIKQHAAMKRFEIGRIAFRAVEDRSERFAIEQGLIKQFSPVCNCQWPQPRDVMTGRFMKEQAIQ
jgi:excinuclease UvrABC nuclease subunit